MIVFVGVDALDHVLSLEIELHELLQDHDVDRDLTQAYENTACDFFELLRFIPLVSADVLDAVPDFGVCLQNAPDHVFSVIARYLGNREVAVQDFLVQVGRVGVLEGQVAANQRKQNNTTRPDVDLTTVVKLTSDHFRRGVAGRPTSCLEHLAVLVSVRKPEVYDLDVLVVV